MSFFQHPEMIELHVVWSRLHPANTKVRWAKYKPQIFRNTALGTSSILGSLESGVESGWARRPFAPLALIHRAPGARGSRRSTLGFVVCTCCVGRRRGPCRFAGMPSSMAMRAACRFACLPNFRSMVASWLGVATSLRIREAPWGPRILGTVSDSASRHNVGDTALDNAWGVQTTTSCGFVG